MRFISLFLFSFVLSASLLAQKNNLLRIDKQEVSSQEFERLFLKNRLEKTPITSKEIDDYLDLFINFKLKVKEAEDLGLDTLLSFTSELKTYRSQLTKPYFENDKIIDQLVAEAYKRMQFEIRASHILVKVGENAPPADTLRAYDKAMRLRTRLVKKANFAELAKSFSDDPSATQNGGDLGYFTALQMVYPFENAAYNLKIGEISMPVRTKFGYHIIYLADKRPARGSVKVAHIMKLVPKDATLEQKQAAKKQIDSIYALLKNKASFEDLAQKYSDDHSSSTNGGELPWFASGRMIKDFEDQSFNLKKTGDISQPFETIFGWHIVKLIDKKGVPPFEQMKDDLYSKVKKDERSSLSKQVVVDKLKSQYNYQEFYKMNLFLDNVDTTIFSGSWTSQDIPQKETTMFSFNNQTYTVGNFATYLEENQPRRAYSSATIEPYLQHQYDQFVEDNLFAYEDSQLEQKYPDFALLIKEYHDGILLFNISGQEIWNKAATDSAGLRKFYEKNITQFSMPAKVDFSVFTFQSKKINRKWKKILANFNTTQSLADTDIVLITQLYDPKFKLETSGLYNMSDSIVTESGLSESDFENVGSFVFNKNKDKIYYIRKFVPQSFQKFEAVKGLLISDYQTKLEEDWIKELKIKHQVYVDMPEFNKVKAELLKENK
jgi:peptidyl-prolyl cis-trans isomerase SurA